MGVDLSDPEDKWVYYSPMSWHPDSTRALWNERTRLNAGPVQCRLQICRLLDKAPSEPVPAAQTPDSRDVPYAHPITDALKQEMPIFPLKIRGKTGLVQNGPVEGGAWETRYKHYSEDGETVYDGFIRVKAPANMFRPGKTTIESDLTVTGAHQGQMKLRLEMYSDERFQIYPDFSADENGQPKSFGFAEYDGLRREVSELAP